MTASLTFSKIMEMFPLDDFWPQWLRQNDIDQNDWWCLGSTTVSKELAVSCPQIMLNKKIIKDNLDLFTTFYIHPRSLNMNIEWFFPNKPSSHCNKLVQSFPPTLVKDWASVKLNNQLHNLLVHGRGARHFSSIVSGPIPTIWWKTWNDAIGLFSDFHFHLYPCQTSSFWTSLLRL